MTAKQNNDKTWILFIVFLSFLIFPSCLKKAENREDGVTKYNFNEYIDCIVKEDFTNNRDIIGFGLNCELPGCYYFYDEVNYKSYVLVFTLADDYSYGIERVEEKIRDKRYMNEPNPERKIISDLVFAIKKYGICGFGYHKNTGDCRVVSFDTKFINKNTIPKCERQVDDWNISYKTPKFIVGTLYSVADEKWFLNSVTYKHDKPVRIKDGLFYAERYSNIARLEKTNVLQRNKWKFKELSK